ncbi:MAG: BatD family protein, partial [Armatimonadota bacterium]
MVVFLLVMRSTCLAADDKIPYSLVVDPSAADVGETVRVTFVVTGIAPAEVSVTAPPLPRGLELVRGPFIRPLLPGEGSVIEYGLRCTAEGVYTVPGFTLRAEGAQTTTSGFRIAVRGRETPNGPAGGGGPSVGVPRFRWTAAAARVEVNRSIPIFLVTDSTISEEDIRGVRYQKPAAGIASDFARPKELFLSMESGSRTGKDGAVAA